MNVTQWAEAIRAKRRSFRPAQNAEDESEPLRALIHLVEIEAGPNGGRIIIDGQEFEGALDVAVEYGIDKPAVVTLKFYALIGKRGEDGG